MSLMEGNTENNVYTPSVRESQTSLCILDEEKGVLKFFGTLFVSLFMVML